MSGRAPRRLWAAGITTAILAALVLAADQFTKNLAIENLEPTTTVPVIGEVLQFYLIRNPGAAFSLGENVTWLFTLALTAVAAVIVFLAASRVRSRGWSIALGLLLGGVLGNLTDRFFRPPGFPVGHVVDFISTPWMWFWTTPAIYNIADIFIVTSMIAVAVLVLFGFRMDGTREAHEKKRTGEADGGTAADGETDRDADGEPDGGPAGAEPRSRE